MVSEVKSIDPSGKLGRTVKGLSGTKHDDLEKWPTPDEGALTEKCRSQYLRRKKAVKLYLEGYSQKDLLENCGLKLNHVYRLITERCAAIHPDGQIYGWRGLIPNLRIKAYTRKKSVKADEYGYGCSGAMLAVLLAHPELRQRFDKRILESPKQNKLGPQKRPRQGHLKWFLDELRKLGYEQRNQWPFSTKFNGYVSVCKYVDAVLLNNPKLAAKVLGGPDLEKKLISGDGVGRPVEQVYQRVEMDAHKLDGRFCVMIPDNIGGHVPKIIHRIWVIVIIDVVSRAVLGYFLSMGKEVSKHDVMRTIKMALTRWHPRTLSFNKQAYNTNAALPSGVSDKYIGVCWNETSVDGALAETCKHVETVLMDTVGSTLLTPDTSFSCRRSKDDRPFIEAFFRTLSVFGFQKLSNTTGANPKEKQGRDPEKIAVASQFQLEYAAELLDVLIANYNAMPHTSLGYRSPLEYLDYICSKPNTVLRYADPNSVQGLLSFAKNCRVNGDLEKGRKPFVNFKGAKYTNETLQQRFDLVGKYLWVTNHLEDDARIVQASTLEGQSLGILRASPPWHKLPHSLEVRSAINASIHRRMISISGNVDAVEAFLEFYEAQPNGKLPVHPAYLEVRRILAQQADQNLGKTLLDNALRSNEIEIPASKQIEKKVGILDDDTLPPRHMAVSK